MPSIREVKRIKSITLLVGAPTKDMSWTVNWTGSLWWFFFFYRSYYWRNDLVHWLRQHMLLLVLPMDTHNTKKLGC